MAIDLETVRNISMDISGTFRVADYIGGGANCRRFQILEAADAEERLKGGISEAKN